MVVWVVKTVLVPIGQVEGHRVTVITDGCPLLAVELELAMLMLLDDVVGTGGVEVGTGEVDDGVTCGWLVAEVGILEEYGGGASDVETLRGVLVLVSA